ncbi:hypothetical protein [Thalassobellus suaedae]|uniref:Uncharacterized protein n=1 Tax=Thalassobellus suaedae TaxID=3074124 RepID=A0ABY9XYF0_9FLAO|nr:hypothetical protein RHP51_09550 [Flavobacteriaceae bacterium HL-DH14]
MTISEKIKLVEERLKFINQLTDLKENFRGNDKAISGKEPRNWQHPYEHFSALRFYLLITCFDILGQSNDWQDYGSWLQSKNKANERNKVISKHQKRESNDFLISVNKDYNEIYGVKKSFLKFIREVITDKNRTKLFDSIKGTKKLTDDIYNDDGTVTVSTARRIELTQNQKEDFLFKIRNSFTHKGVSIGDKAGGIFDNEKPLKFGIEEPVWMFHSIHYQKIKGDTIIFSIRRWYHSFLSKL